MWVPKVRLCDVILLIEMGVELKLKMADALEILGALRFELEALCKAYAVKRLRIFGSALTREWNPENSDFDFVVEFDSLPEKMHAFDQYFEFKQALERLLGRSVDLVELSAVRNSFFRRNLERAAKEWYAA